MKNLFLVFFLVPTVLFSQKKTIDHTVYNSWKSISNVKLSSNGKYTIFTIKPLRGDGYLYLINNETGKKDSILRANDAVFSGTNSFLAFKITPGFDTLRNCELKKIKKDKWPKDSLGIYLFEKDTIIKFPKIKSFSVAENSDWIAFFKEDNKADQPKEKTKKRRKKKKDHAEKEIKSDGTALNYFNPLSNDIITHLNVTEIQLSKYNNIAVALLHQKEKTDSVTLQITDLDKKETWNLSPKFTQVSKLTFNEKGTNLAFMASMDTVQKNKIFALYYLTVADKTLTKLIDTLDVQLPKGKSVNEKSPLYFSENGSRLFFGVADKPLPNVKDTLLESEKAVLDLWSWTDDRLQPQQLKELKKDEAKSDLYYFELPDKRLKMVAGDSMIVSMSRNANENFVLAYYNKPYEYSYQWDSPGKSDIYLINVTNGEQKLLKKGGVYQYDLSPSGNFLTYYNEPDQHLYLMNIPENTSTCVTCLEKDDWLEDVNGRSEIPGMVTNTVWVRNHDGLKEKTFFIHSESNYYEYDIQKHQLRVISNAGSKQNTWKFNSMVKWSPDSLYFHPDNVYIKAKNKIDKSEAIFKVELINNQYMLVEKMKYDESFLGIKKAKNNATLAFQKQSLVNFPDVFISSWETNVPPKQISLANPQQKEYNWANVSLISWKNYEGEQLEGLFYKPENFDPSKKYPLMIYYYELHSDDIHVHYAPKPTASIIHPTEYASSGYLVFIPDIRYKLGHPAKSAYSCIMSGTDYVLRQFPQIDSTRMGLQGQSWGGYQTAQLITMTKRYKAAMAGAPVSNMFSAYGGIRWGSGLNRQFQYEKQQSRIGKTIWQAPELYVENSPLFHLPNVVTPLLIMHNDMDGAVPWYQGIELFTGLKRLQKPVWLLNYNGDDHNLTKIANKMDLSVRMKQFFDHYLMDKPAPVWMTEGLPAIDKGKRYGLEVK